MRKLIISPLLLGIILLISCGTENTPVYTLSSTSNPSEAGTVTPSSGEYDEGEEVELTAEPEEGWLFDQWQGDGSGSQATATITMDADKDVTARFVKREYPLIIDTEGEGSVSEEVVQEKSTDYEDGTVVELTANPDDGWEFVEWEGDVNSTDNPATITVDEEKEVTAVFEIKAYPLEIDVEGEGSVSEEVVQEKSTDYEDGTVVELTANPDDGWEFKEWQGDLQGTQSPETLDIDSEKSIKAIFERVEYTIDTSVEGLGTVTITPDEEVYYEGDEITITVEPDNGWKIVYWEGDFEGSDTEIELTLDQDISATAILGDGSENYPFGISSAEELQEIAENENLDKHFIQLNDIDATKTAGWNGGAGFEPIGDSPDRFTGSYDGDGYVISGLAIDRGSENSVGLFGLFEGMIKNVGLDNAEVSGEDRVGGLVGNNLDGEINNSYFNGDVSGNSYVGGLVGSHDGKISNTYALGNVTGDDTVGGLVGATGIGGTATVTTSYAASEVTADSDPQGGFAGYNGAAIENSYWDTEASNQTDGVGTQDGEAYLEGLTTSEMTGVSAEDNMPAFDWSSVWKTTSDDYPKLQWQD